MKKIVSILNIGLALVFLFLTIVGASDEINQIKQAIAKKGAAWTAGESWVTKLSLENRKKLCGAIIEPPESLKGKMLTLPMNENLPEQLDWRNNNGNWVTPVKNQGNCGSCWDFAAIAQVEALWKIHNANLDSMIDLSEQFILSCGNAGDCFTGSSAYVFEFIKNVGVPSESCLPYSANDSIPCDSACSNWMDEAVVIPDWGWITQGEALIEKIKNAVFIQPVLSIFIVYEDFTYYSGGVYQHVWGNAFGGHYILIVGWDDAEQSWICKNSWGPDWGDAGYFRIKWDQCLIGKWAPFIWKEINGDSLISISPQQFDLTVSAGDTSVEKIIIKNSGKNTLSYSLLDCGSSNLFHSDDFLAFDSVSWWSGDTLLNGYDDNCLQYLETPRLNLSNTNTPVLTWMGRWMLESTGNYGPYDGFDGCNVWISVDGGKSFNIAYPTNPPYNCTNLYSFSNPQGWNLGSTVPGWGGRNDDWTSIEFDLALYKSDSIIIRFAFASDETNCTLIDSTLLGFFVDDIKVSDGNTIIFEDDANEINTMKQIGYGFRKADWIFLDKSMGQIKANDSNVIKIKIDASNLSPGDYSGLIKVETSDTLVSEIEIPIRCKVNPPTTISIADNIPVNFKLKQNYPNPFNPKTVISYQLAVGSNVDLSIYNILGQKVSTLVRGKQKAGSYKVEWNATGFASGIYLYKLTTNQGFRETKRLILLK